jgi:hypothetical protein
MKYEGRVMIDKGTVVLRSCVDLLTVVPTL